MRAARIESYGGPDVAQIVDLPLPVPGPGEVRVRVGFAGVNFMDIHTRQGKYRASRTYGIRAPLTLGMEGAGIIDAIGAGVSGLRPGQRVAWCLAWGSYADYAVVPASRLILVPDALSLEAAAACTFHGLTAHYLVHDTAALGSGESALVLAASGGIGQILVQLGAAMGARMFAVTSTADRADRAMQQGAIDAFLYSDGGYAEAARAATDGIGVKVAFDPVGAPTLRHTLRAVRKRGLVVNFGSVGGSLSDLDPIDLGEAGSLFLTRPRLADHIADADITRRRAADIFAMVLNGQLRIARDRTYPFDAFQEAHDALDKRRTRGKQLLRLAGELD